MRYVQYSFIFVQNPYHFSRMAESSGSHSNHSNNEGTEQLQTHENPFLTVRLRAESSGLEKTLGHINQNMAKMSSFLERMCGSGQQNLAASENSPPAKRPARKDLLSLPNHPKEVHPLWNKLTLMVCFLSGTA